MFSPLMKIIMKYFTCEGRFSIIYGYHIILLTQFTRVKLLNISYYLYRSIENMPYKVQHRKSELQQKYLFHHSLIKIIVFYHLKQLKINWDTFIGEEVFFPSSN